MTKLLLAFGLSLAFLGRAAATIVGGSVTGAPPFSLAARSLS